MVNDHHITMYYPDVKNVIKSIKETKSMYKCYFTVLKFLKKEMPKKG